ncbi:hypothetical protein PVAP13_5KG395600 [Panicum virgatum]|uniref:Uncharacterized protein n=1 Tax=Panicum virgatum TaxID=38727 RepID=A0A8T0SRL0_PANVG|nr:hypothetical protein PVAP13_5KG395600 [Panicum virgatum]
MGFGLGSQGIVIPTEVSLLEAVPAPSSVERGRGSSSLAPQPPMAQGELPGGRPLYVVEGGSGSSSLASQNI